MLNLNRKASSYLIFMCFICFAVPLLFNGAEAAVYWNGQSNKSQVTDLYQELIVVECGDSLYTAQQFPAGYLGLAGHTIIEDHWVNFSIWDNGQGDLNYVVEGPDPRLGGTVERFGNEGTGAKTTTKLLWEFDVYYKTYVKVEHIEGGTLWSGWIARADSQDWYICGRIYVPNVTQWAGSGGIFLETLSDHDGLLGIRINGEKLGWVKDSSGWGGMTGMAWSCQEIHIEHASGYEADNTVFLTFEADNRAPWYPATWYQWPAGLVPSPSTAPATMPAFEGVIEDISACPTTNAIPKDDWSLLYVDSEETAAEDGAAINAFDDDTATYWHTEWSSSSPSHPHEIQIDLGASYSIDGFGYLPREGSLNGTIDDYEFYVSTDGSNWGSPVASGSWGGVVGMCRTETFPAVVARYVALVALSEINGNPWTSAAEINVYDDGSGPIQMDMYVNDITMSWRKGGSRYYGRANVWIKDAGGANVEGATVYGNWTGAVNAADSGVTQSDGKVTIESPGVKNGGTFTFTVTNVVKSGYVYNSALNVETSDSITAP